MSFETPNIGTGLAPEDEAKDISAGLASAEDELNRIGEKLPEVDLGESPEEQTDRLMDAV